MNQDMKQNVDPDRLLSQLLELGTHDPGVFATNY